MVEDELVAALEQVKQARLAVETSKGIILFDFDHRQPAAFGIQGVSRPRGGLFLDKQFFAGVIPLGARHDFGESQFCFHRMTFATPATMAAMPASLATISGRGRSFS